MKFVIDRVSNLNGVSFLFSSKILLVENLGNFGILTVVSVAKRFLYFFFNCVMKFVW